MSPQQKGYVKLVHGALDEVDGGEIILRGSLDNESLHLLKAADYQREVLPLTSILKLVKGFENGSVPDIDVGMRGEDFVDRNGVYTLKNDCYIIDGLQRVTAAIKMLQKPDGKEPRLGAVVHFGTTEEWERERFRILNADRTKLSPNVLLRNFRQSVPAIDLLYHLSGEQEFALKGRISWGQRMNRDHLTTALSVCKVISILHSGIMVGLRGHRLDEIVIGLQTVMSKIGRDKFRRNVITFFDVIDEAWGIRSVAFKEGTPHIRNTFLFTVATLLAKNSMFWEKDELTVPQEDRKRFRSFPLNDPNVRNLSGAGGRATHILYQLFVEHMNHGRRSRKLSETVFGHAYPIADGA